MAISLNLDLPRLRRRARAEADKVVHAADGAARAVGGVHLPPVGVGGSIASARRALGDARRTLAEGSDQLAHGAEHAAARAGEIGHGLRGAVEDVRSLRLVRQPPRRRDPWPGLALVGGIAAGIAAMFLLDPQDGRRRRALLRDKLGKWSRVAAREARGRSKDLANRTQGLVHDVRTAIPIRAEQPAEPVGEGTPDWASQEPVGAGVGGGTGSSTYGEVGYEPGPPNGRENG